MAKIGEDDTALRAAMSRWEEEYHKVDKGVVVWIILPRYLSSLNVDDNWRVEWLTKWRNGVWSSRLWALKPSVVTDR